MTQHILILAGDGIGPEVTYEAKRILEAVAGEHFTFSEALIGGSAYDATGTPFPEETLEAAKSADAILLGAVGGPKWESLDYSVRPERGLLGLRKELQLFANLRPCICFDALADASSLKEDIIAGLDVLIVRELTGGIYFGEPRGVETLENGSRRGINSLVYITPEIERIARVSAELARKRGKKLCSIDKANVLEATELWRDTVTEVCQAGFNDIELSHMYVDNAAMQLVRNPKQFDVIVTTNMFGDILSDIGAQLTGSLGMLPSASLGSPDTPGLYEPVHGSAPDIAGKGIANPIAMILSAAMMLRYSFDMAGKADAIEQAVVTVLADGLRTPDIMQDGKQKVGTTAMGDAIIAAIPSA